MSHPDPMFDFDNSHEEDGMDFDSNYDCAAYDDGYYDANYDDHDDFYSNDSDPDGDGDYDPDYDYDDSMDGDHDSAMTSAGWGTDEDYGHYGDDIDAFYDYYGGE